MTLLIGATFAVVATLLFVACLRAQHLATSISTRFMEDVEQMRAVRPQLQRRTSPDPLVTAF
jgi:hypothetical protein